jgi:signal transduction histidine kinase
MLRDPSRRRLVVIALVGIVYYVGLDLALHLDWHPQGLPGYRYLGAVALIAAATTDRWPLETLTNTALVTAYVSLGPLPPEIYGLYIRPPESLVPLAVVTFLMIAGRGPVVAPAATFGTLAALVIVPWKDIVEAAKEHRPISEALLLDTDTDRSILFGELVACALVVLFAGMLRRQRQATAELAAKNRELLELRAAEVARIAEHERARIARDVHDEVAHHVAALVIRAQAALRVADRQPEQLALAMRDITEGGQDVLARIRTVVRMLKSAPVDAVPAAVRPLGADLEVLLDRVRSIGYEVDSRVRVGQDLPTPQRTAILRVVQESLTNIMLHSSAREVSVRVEETPVTWTVTVTDPGPSHERFPDVPRGGSGIPSMTDRVALLGGRVESGRTFADSGWSVHAELPRRTASSRRRDPSARRRLEPGRREGAA